MCHTSVVFKIKLNQCNVIKEYKEQFEFRNKYFKTSPTPFIVKCFATVLVAYFTVLIKP